MSTSPIPGGSVTGSTAASGTVTAASTAQWKDRKRYLWLIGLVVPSLAFLGYGAWTLTGGERHGVVGLVGEAQQPPQLLRDLEGDARLLRDLHPRQAGLLPEQVPLDDLERVGEVGAVEVGQLSSRRAGRRPRCAGPRRTPGSRRRGGVRRRR